jgi:hypothetical protein
VTARVAVLLALALVACDRTPDASSVRTLTLPSLETAMPDAPGRSEFVGSCRTCHSPRYVLDQPRFPRKTWAAEVEKMKTAYGAPIPPDAQPLIVDYLVAIRGTPE